MDYYPALKRNETGSFAEMWMDLEIVIQWSTSEREKQVSCINTYMWNLEKTVSMTLFDADIMCGRNQRFLMSSLLSMVEPWVKASLQRRTQVYSLAGQVQMLEGNPNDCPFSPPIFGFQRTILGPHASSWWFCDHQSLTPMSLDLIWVNLFYLEYSIREEGEDFPGGSVVKNLPDNAGDAGSIPGLGRSPGEINSNPLQYACLENPMERGAWWATVPGVTKELDMI